MSYIEIKNLTKIINGNVILDDVTLSLEKNKIYGFVGINGSGKTMLLRAIAGLITANEGTVIVDNMKIGKGIHPESVGLLIENADLWSDLTALENLKILNKMSRKCVSDEALVSMLEKVGLESKKTKIYKAFSLGMKQKLRIAQAFLGEPDLLILDEPNNALDEKSVENLRNMILESKEKGSTVLLASHSNADIEILCDEIIFIESGKIKEIRKAEK